MTRSAASLWSKFADKDYRHAYVCDFLDGRIATQIQILRKKRSMSQADLASMIETKQSKISQFEDVNYGKWTLTTLKKLAEAFDVALVVRFEPFSRVLGEIVDFSEESIAVPSFGQDKLATNFLWTSNVLLTLSKGGQVVGPKPSDYQTETMPTWLLESPEENTRALENPEMTLPLYRLNSAATKLSASYMPISPE